MASISALRSQATGNIASALLPVQVRWNALDAGPRRLLVIGALLLAAGFLAAFVWLPAIRTRDALTIRLPQMEARLATMRKQAQEVKALAGAPVLPAATRTVADVAALQSVFGPDAQVSVADGGFRIVIPAIAYASWWDKTGDALSRHPLALQAASLARVGASGSVVAVDMRLGIESRAMNTAQTPRPGK